MVRSGFVAHRRRFLDRLASHWTGSRPHYRAQLLKSIGDLFDRFMEEGLADPTFPEQLANGVDWTHEQRLAEMLLADNLWHSGFHLSSKATGPDFLATKNGKSVWIELITPQPSGIDPGWLDPSHAGVFDYPHKEIALRYTAALKEKHAKLVGSDDGKPGYLETGCVRTSDPYVIAINQHLLQRAFRDLTGISQIPTACEVLFAIGPQQLHLDPLTMAVTDQDHVHRPYLQKSVHVQVPTDSFLHPNYKPVSAVFALDLVLDKFITPDKGHALMREDLTAMVYNPYATNPLLPCWIPAQTHWEAKVTSGIIEVESL